MQGLLDDAMDSGAWGLSTGLIYAPGSYATTEEIVAIARAAAAGGGFYASHIRGEGATLVNGRVVLADGDHTGSLPGRVLRP